MEKPNTAQIILGTWILIIAVSIIPLVWIYGDEFLGSQLGTQLVFASLGFVILVLQVCQFVSV